ncbi:unnamed protein product [Citrullus colocynthis]|uniref:Uncharacterized protein n=1 Tax=Citrullus colocynthis TaxID=252529 RepID=A0ABP0XN94_9ROSI
MVSKPIDSNQIVGEISLSLQEIRLDYLNLSTACLDENVYNTLILKEVDKMEKEAIMTKKQTVGKIPSTTSGDIERTNQNASKQTKRSRGGNAFKDHEIAIHHKFWIDETK